MKAFLNKNFLFLLAMAGILYFVFKASRKKKNAQPVARSFVAQPIERIDDSSRTVAGINPKASIPTLRNQARDRMDLGGSFVKPEVTSKGLRVNFELNPTGRACQNGDIDLIRSVAGESGELLLTVEDSNQKVLVERTMRTDQLRTKQLISFDIPVRQALQVFRLSICSDNRRRSCSKLNSIDFKALENAVIRNPKQRSFTADYLFYSYSFATHDGGLHLFDSTAERPPQKYRKYLTSHAGSDSQFDFLTGSLAEARKLGAVPAQVKGNRLAMALYYNDSSTCEISLQGGRNEK